MVINANEVKKRGVSVFEELLKKWDEIIITFRGKKKYVVIDIDRYNELREKELELAYKEVLEDYKNGEYRIVNAKEHIENIKRDLNV
ncbi:prevent-host-death protein [Caminibacter pacificus]|jgi:PHD/YefM family antitoxin component YafN of YafNO toxin-antitoxin module